MLISLLRNKGFLGEGGQNQRSFLCCMLKMKKKKATLLSFVKDIGDPIYYLKV